jgi:ribosomal protein S18 acetylase RimI-like enzyme
MEIKFAQDKDIGSWMELVERVKDSFPGIDLEEYRKGLSLRISGRGALAAVESGRVIGALLFSGEAKELEFLAVHPDFRKKGIAASLIRYLFSLLPKGSRFSVITYRENDPQGKAARELYRSIGFIPDRLLTVFDYPCQKLIYTIE